MVKTIISKYLILVCLISLSLLTACSGGSYILKEGSIKTENNLIEGSYEYFSGTYYKNIKIDQNKKISINFDSRTEGGNISANLIDIDNGTIIDLGGKEYNNNELIIENAGSYRLRVNGNKHKGSFILSWNIQWHAYKN